MSDIREMKVTGHIQELVANPTPLGLFGLAMVTLVASTSKLGITDGTAYVIPWAIFLGACAQLIAGIMDYKHDNTFGATAFSAYGLFWMAMAISWMISNNMWGNGVAFDIQQMGYAFLGYFIFTMFMTIGAMGANKVLFIIFCLIDLLFFGLFMSTLGWGGEAFHMLAAYAELGIAITSFYGCGATVLNSHYGITVLPIGKAFGPWTKKAIAAKNGVAM
ncbi:MAG TPA: acetate uptake transporter [Syntrophomonadaceae bacterium]|nr:acetate uptake transporter [Syntrophomonadaceae bacterium]